MSDSPVIARHRILILLATLVCLACAPAPRWVAVAVPRGVLVFDGSLQPAGRLLLPAPPERLAFAADGASLFAGVSPAPGSAVLARFGRGQGAALMGGRAAFGGLRRLVLTPDGGTLLLALGGKVGLGIASAGTLALERPLVGCDATDLVLAAGGERVYVLCGEGRVEEVDPELRLRVKSVKLPAGPAHCRPSAGALSANGTVLFVACAASGQLLYLDRVTLAPFDSVTIAPGAARVVMTPGGGLALLANPGAGALAVVDVRARVVRHIMPIPGAVDVAVAADGRAFVVGDRRLFEVDAEEGRVLRDRELEEAAAAVAVWPGLHDSRMRWDYGTPDPGISASVSASQAARS